ncbi:TonB-dependent receptor plug domain-containing protein [Acetobacter sp. LMG 1636]|uniref:TonB-dependent receptor plug domain-containing protein n=1 Tax=Acetobacter fallax TaxID=1737473 RepID=A0ABX0KD76_9PROT|nr:TonB-dependent receptor plug domain-containing protein [Acetobacter fallax]NHO37485.1 TonB-dependent receptor plug domain-containing protein [Acetobacter fallax]
MVPSGSGCRLPEWPRHGVALLKLQRKAIILCCTALVATGGKPSSSRARTPSAHKPVHHAATRGAGTTATTQATVSGATTSAAKTPRRTGVDAAGEAESVTVHAAGVASATGVTNTTPGGGLMPPQTVARSQSGMTRDYIAKQSPAVSPSVMLSALPGVVGGASDPYGGSAHDGLTVRGLTQGEIGYVMQGIPLGDPVNPNIFSADMVDNENIGAMTLTQGSSDIWAPFYSAVGGQVTIDTVMPGSTMGGLLDLSYGNNNMRREFLRLDSGEIGHSGIKAFASYSNNHYDQWRGLGGVDRHHVDFKAVKEWGDDNHVWANFGWNHQSGQSLRYPTMAQYEEYGNHYNWDANYTPGDTSYRKFHTQTRTDTLASIQAHLNLHHGMTLDITPYYIADAAFYNGGENLNNEGSYLGNQQLGNLNLPWQTNGVTTAMSFDHESESTGGITTAFTWKTAHNTLTLGNWYAYLQHSELESFTPADYSGSVSNSFGKYPIIVGGKVLTGYDINFKQQTNALFINDKYSALNDKLILNAGFREVMIHRVATNEIPGENYMNGGSYAEPLPQFSATYFITKNDQVYINGTTSFRAPGSEEIYIDLWDPNGHGVPTMQRRTEQKSEFAIGEEVGFRHKGLVSFSLALFNYNLVHHQVNSSNYIGTQLVTQPIDMGGETIRGLQAEVGLRPWHHFSPYIAFQYLHTTIDNNYMVGGYALPTAGKTMVMSPTLSGSAGINYDDGHIFGNLFASWAGRQYSTFMNDESIPAYVVGNLTAGYRFNNVGFMKHPQIQINVSNFANNHYLSGVYGYSANAHAVNVGGHTIAGSAPSYYIGSTPAVICSVTTGF